MGLSILLRGKPEIPISSCLDPSGALSSTRAIVVLLTNAVNLPIKLTKPSVVVVNWRPMGSGGGCHYVCTPFELPQARSQAGEWCEVGAPLDSGIRWRRGPFALRGADLYSLQFKQQSAGDHREK